MITEVNSVGRGKGEKVKEPDEFVKETEKKGIRWNDGLSSPNTPYRY